MQRGERGKGVGRGGLVDTQIAVVAYAFGWKPSDFDVTLAILNAWHSRALTVLTKIR